MNRNVLLALDVASKAVQPVHYFKGDYWSVVLEGRTLCAYNMSGDLDIIDLDRRNSPS